MNLRRTLLSGLVASSFALGGVAAFAQDATPGMASPSAGTPVIATTSLEDIPIVNADGVIVAHVDVWEDESGEGVWFSITGAGDAAPEPGKYGVHLHETGTCDATTDPPFDSAGGHFNPTDEHHGDINADPSHGGDLGNLEVHDDGGFHHEVLAEKISLQTGEMNSIADADGTALVIHAGEDDLTTDLSGDSGARWACAEIVPDPASHGVENATPMSGTPVASPEAMPAD